MDDTEPLSYFGSAAPCQVCGEPGRACARCRVDYYCGKQHQRRDWARHKAGCGSVQRREGRVVAVRDIPAGTVLIKEVPAVCFPVAFSYEVLCVGCCAVLESRAVSQCRRCGLPVCNEACSQAAEHRPECDVFERAEFKLKNEDLPALVMCVNMAVSTLRIALAVKEKPRLGQLNSTIGPEQRRALKVKSKASEHMANVLKLHEVTVKWLTTVVGVKGLTREELSRAALLRLLHQPFNTSPDLGTLPPEPEAAACCSYVCERDEERRRILASARDRRYRRGMLYLGIAQLGHDCTPNTASMPWSSDGSTDHVVIASRDIAAGEPISYSKISWEDPTAKRQTALLSCWGVACRCRRCMDPSELGLHVGSPACPTCAAAGARPLSFLTASLDEPDVWRCGGCGEQRSREAVSRLTRAAVKEFTRLSETAADEEQWWNFIQEQQHPRGPLHPTHWLVIGAKIELRQDVFFRRAEYFSPPEKLGRWEQVCADLLRVMDVLYPGLSEDRVRIILQQRRLLLARLETAHKRFDFDGIRKCNIQMKKVNKEMCKHIYNNEKLRQMYPY